MDSEEEWFENGEPLFIECHCCNCASHNLIAEYSIEIVTNAVCNSDYSAIWLYTQPVRGTLWQRIVYAIGHIFNFGNRRYETIHFTKEYAVEFREYLTKFIERHSDITSASQEWNSRHG